ncbi:hypothetical protein BD770DRAFT_330419 [Pilaira anomala]|nr:hypothetical protein BD770DRAFT_330419 [Pilaira anomala]
MTFDLKNIKLYYLAPLKNNSILGRGENIRLLLEDAGIDYEYIRYTFEEWAVEKKRLVTEEKIPDPTLPFIRVNDGKYYGKTMPTARFLSRKLGKYDGANEDQVQLLEAHSDIINDWILRWVNVEFFNPTDTKLKTYKEEVGPEYAHIANKILSDSTEGPYILGESISYVDFALFHILEDDKYANYSADTHPHIVSFVNAIKNRPNLKNYLASDRN